MKIGRNAPCPCRSGKKYKYCHGRLGTGALPVPDAAHPLQFLRDHHEARERIRQAQQGRGKPVIAAKFHGTQLVAVGSGIHHSPNWKTFIDFLGDYLKAKLTPEWGNAELSKPLSERHTIMQWYDTLCRLQAEVIKTPGKVVEMEMNGVLSCYFGLAYSLYLLDHNAELQSRLLARLKNRSNFQGAYYELVVARALIKAGYELTLEDETDRLAKHCEFAAVSKDTGKKFWVEAKMRGVAGLMGKTREDGVSASKSRKATSMLITHLNAALKKPAADERMIFIDLNAEMSGDFDDDNRPPFAYEVTARLQRYEERELEVAKSAYVFVTNMTFHRDLLGPAQMASIPFGVGIEDFNRPGNYRLAEIYRRDKKHADAMRVADSLADLLTFPATFDGQMPSTAFHDEKEPVQIGQRYCFEGAGPDATDLTGTVSDVTVLESEKAAYVAVNTDEGTGHILKEEMSDNQLADYRAHKDAYFGKVKYVSDGVSNPYDLFKFFVHAHAQVTRQQLLEKLKLSDGEARDLSDEDLLLDYSERMVAGSGMFQSVDGVLQAFPKKGAGN